MSDAAAATGPRLYAIRGAIDAAADTPEDIRRAVSELVTKIGTRNALRETDIVSAQFTMTPDLRCVFPASAARQAGWTSVPMLCAAAVEVPEDLPRCIRVLVHAYLQEGRTPEHIYLGRAVTLRPDLNPGSPRD